LDSDEYRRLVEYYEDLRRSSPESYALFYNDHADMLFRQYGIWLPPFVVDVSDLINLIVKHPELTASLTSEPMFLDEVPLEYRPFLGKMLGQPESRRLMIQLLQTAAQPESKEKTLPKPREQEPIYMYEDGNPYKEIGLKTHFDRLGRFNFVTRLQSYRYLSHKASQDRIQYLSPDCLGGIFSNKEKSIYYYIFLSEDNQVKAENAARLLNLAVYGKSGGS